MRWSRYRSSRDRIAPEQLDWAAAFEHLQDVRRAYTDIGASGIPGLTITLNPLLLRYERGERTPELYAEIMGTE